MRSDLAVHHAVMRARNGGEVIIGGVPYDAAVVLSAVELESMDGGRVRGSMIKASILKTALLSPPARDAKITFAGVDYSLQIIGGSEARDVSWVLEATRALK
jgi:hypothetical protein